MAPLPGNVLPRFLQSAPIVEIYRYRLAGPPNYSVLDLKTLQELGAATALPPVSRVSYVTGWAQDQTYEPSGRLQQADRHRTDVAALREAS